MSKPIAVTLTDETALKRVADIVGPSSAAAMALNEAARRRAGGEDVHIFQTMTNSYLVGPMPDSATAN